MSKVFSPNSKPLLRAAGIVRGGTRFLVATHRHPDGDALGSALALSFGLKRLGKTATVYNADPVPYCLRFLPGWRTVTNRLPANARFDAAFVVDCSELGRVGDVFAAHKGLGPVILLDHHVRGKKGGDIRVVDGRAASSGVVVHRLLRRLGVRVTPQIATQIYVTLVTDTGGFRYANTSSDVLRLAADLVRMGADPDRINRALNDREPPAKLKLLSHVLKGLRLFGKGRIGMVVVTRALLKKYGATLEMVDDFVNYPRSLAGVEVSVLFRESPEGWRVSLRSKERADVGAVAAALGGGGHVRAAGFTGRGSLNAVRGMLLKYLEKEGILRLQA